jgi:hypothetical protein
MWGGKQIDEFAVSTAYQARASARKVQGAGIGVLREASKLTRCGNFILRVEVKKNWACTERRTEESGGVVLESLLWFF